jgi:hypothetical protein
VGTADKYGQHLPGICREDIFPDMCGLPPRKPQRPKKKFIKALRHSKPIVPKHQSPKAIGEKFESLVQAKDKAFFNDFKQFANVVNWWLSDPHVGGPWRLQELPDTDLVLHGSFDHGPTFGRRYAIFHNQVRLGELEVEPIYGSTPSGIYLKALHYTSAIVIHPRESICNRGFISTAP